MNADVLDCGSVRELLREAEILLVRSGIEEARRTCEILAEAAFSCSRAELYCGIREMKRGGTVRFQCLVRERTRGVPYQYLLGTAAFMGLDFKVTPDVLIPRPETEVLAETVLKLDLTGRWDAVSCVDVGTGSGNLAIVLAKFLPEVMVTAIDISRPALSVAQDNAGRHGVRERIRFVCADLLTSFGEGALSADLIISNPPYVPEEEIGGLSREVKREPRLALDGGGGGLSVLRKIISGAPAFLKPGGYLALEIGFGQARAVRDLVLGTQAFGTVNIVPDYRGVERVVLAQKKRGSHGQNRG